MKKQMGQVVGFIVTPEEIANRIAALDASIQGLAQDVAATPSSGKLGTSWRAEFDAFLRRWAIERDSYATWSARLFATRVLPRLADFEQSYRYWARDFQKKSGTAPTVPLARPSEGAAASLVPTEVWWILGIGVGIWVLSQTGPGMARRALRR
jgi:hypothetical protein